MNKKQAEITEEWIGYSSKMLKYAISNMAGARRLKWMKEGNWELETRNLEDQLWILDEEIDDLLGKLYEIADL